MRVRRKEPCLLPSGYKGRSYTEAGVVIVTTLVGPVADYSVAGIDRSGGPALKEPIFPVLLGGAKSVPRLEAAI